MRNKYLLLGLLILLIIPSFWFLAKPGFISTDDGNWMIIRFSAFYQALRDGQFPVRLLGRLNFDYGYPVANFLYPGFMYLAVPFKLVGLSFITVIKLVIAVCMIGSGVFMYLWMEKVFDRFSAFFGALFYVYAPYHLYDLSKRGSVGELLSLAVFPFVMWQIERRSLIFSSIGLAILLVSHNTLAIVFLGFIILYGAISIFLEKNRNQLFGFYIKVICFGLGISAFFWIPAITELSNTVFSKTKISNFSEYFADFGLIGVTSFLILLSTIFVLVWKRGSIKKNYLAVLVLTIGVVSLLFASVLSAPLWDILPVAFVQFPFRMLSLTILCAAFLLSFCLSQLELKYKIVTGIVVMFITIVLSLNFLLPTKYNLEGDEFYSTNEATTTVLDEYMPIWVKNKPSVHPEEKIKITQGEGVLNNVISNSKNILFNFNSQSPAVVQINKIYYPGWKAYSGNIEKAIFYDNDQGLMELKLEGRNQNIRLTFSETPVRSLSDILSILSLIGLFFLVFYKQVLAYIKK